MLVSSFRRSRAEMEWDQDYKLAPEAGRPAAGVGRIARATGPAASALIQIRSNAAFGAYRKANVVTVAKDAIYIPSPV